MQSGARVGGQERRAHTRVPPSLVLCREDPNGTQSRSGGKACCPWGRHSLLPVAAGRGSRKQVPLCPGAWPLLLALLRTLTVALSLPLSEKRMEKSWWPESSARTVLFLGDIL